MKILLLMIGLLFLNSCAFGGFTDKGGWIVGIGELEKDSQKIKCGINIGALPRG